jgi:hypothetical protein
MINRAKKLVNLLERLLKQEHLFNEEQLKEIKSQLKIAKEEIKKIETQTSKGFGKV